MKFVSPFSSELRPLPVLVHNMSLVCLRFDCRFWMFIHLVLRRLLVSNHMLVAHAKYGRFMSSWLGNAARSPSYTWSGSGQRISMYNTSKVMSSRVHGYDTKHITTKEESRFYIQSVTM